MVIVAGCKPKQADAPGAGSKERGQIVAKIDDQVITVADVQDRINRQVPYVRARYQSPERKKELLDSLVQFEVMAKEAKSRGYESDPDVIRVMKQTMISEFVKREFDVKVKPDNVPDADVEKYFREHAAEFNHPEEVRVSQIFTKDKAKAQKAATAAKAIPALDEKAYRNLVTAQSEDEDSKQRGGDLTFFDRNSSTYPKEVVAAAFALKDVGDVSPVVQTGKGFHVLKLTGKRPGFSRPLDEVKTQIQKQIFNQVRTQKMDEFVAEMRKKVKVEVYADKLKDVVIEGAPGGGPPVAK